MNKIVQAINSAVATLDRIASRLDSIDQQLQEQTKLLKSIKGLSEFRAYGQRFSDDGE